MWFWVVGFITYNIFAHITFGPHIKDKWWFPTVVGTLSMINGLIWGQVAKTELDPTKLAIYGFYWDLMVTAIFLAVPIVFYGAVFTPKQAVGIGLVLVGIMCLH